NLVLQKALIGKVQPNRLIGEQDERWWRGSRLRHVVDPDALSGRYGRAVEINCLEKTVHLARRNTFAALGSNLRDQTKQLVEVAARGRAYKDNGRVGQKLQLLAHAALILHWIGRELACGAAPSRAALSSVAF